MDDATEVEKPLPLRALLTRDVVIAAGNYASLSLVDIAFRAIHPVFLSTPIALGGLGLAPPTIGNLLSIYGVLNGVIQVFCFAQLNDRFGSKRVFMCGIAAALPLFATFPLVNSLARAHGYSTLVYAVVVLQIANSVAVSMAYGTPFLRCVHSSGSCRTLADYAARSPAGAIFIFIQNASPNRASLGATNGLSQVRSVPPFSRPCAAADPKPDALCAVQMSVSVMRAIGPAAANSLFSVSIARHYLGGNFVYFVMLAMVCGALGVASLLPRHSRGRA